MEISLQRLKTKDLATLAKRTLETSQSGTHAILNNHPLLTELSARYADYDAVYSKKTFSGKGAEVAVADEERDKAFSSLKAFLFGYHQLDSVPNFQEAKDLYGVFVQFGLDIDRMSYSSQTAQMIKLIEALELPENTQKMALLNVSTAFGVMKTKQDDFEALYSVQAEANAELRQTQSASSIRRDLEQVLKAYFNVLTSMQNVSAWKGVYAEIAELVKAAKNS